MKRPIWATVIGTILISLGGCSILNDLQAINLPAILGEKRISLHNKLNEAETTDVDNAEIRTDSLRAGHSDSTKNSEKEIQLDMAKRALEMPDTTIKWIVRFGYIGIFVSLIYSLAGLFLLIPKRFSIPFCYGALIISIAFSAAKTLILTSHGVSSGTIALTMGATQLFGILLDIILLSVIFASDDKDIYTS